MGCVIQVIGKKDSGKTLTIEKVVKRLKSEGYKVAVIKHSHHEIDLQGKDTYRFWSAGSDYVAFLNGKGVIMGKFDVKSLLKLLPVDVVLIEGFKNLELGKVFEILRPEDSDQLSEEIVGYVHGECKKVEVKLIGDGKVLDNNEYVIMLYNLMEMLNLSEVVRGARSYRDK